MAYQRCDVIRRLCVLCLVFGFLSSGIAIAKDNYAHTSAGEVLRNASGECVQAADGELNYCQAPDSDGDGVNDLIDQCRRTPASLTVDERGCPPDADQDTVADSLDQCPDTKRGVRVNSQGCDLDLDGDGVPYYRDRCQLTPPGSVIDSEGCAEKIIMQDAALKVDEVLFGFDRSDLTVVARQLLDNVAVSINQRLNLTGLRIVGHTDSTGSVGYNQTLSEARAASVKQYLQSRAVMLPIQTSGQGELRPIADNASAEGRRRNRRVEIDIDAS